MTKSSLCYCTATVEAAPVSRGERRRQEIVAVAEQVFLAGGFTETTMQTVALQAGASKETLYRHFGSKEELFAEVINNRATRLRARLDADFERPHALGEILHDLGTNLLGCMTSPEVVALLKIVIAEVPRAPELGRIFHTYGPERTRVRLTELLHAAKARGEFHGTNPALAASLFLGAIVSQSLTTSLVLNDPPPVTSAEIDERVGEAVAMFLQRYVDPRPLGDSASGSAPG